MLNFPKNCAMCGGKWSFNHECPSPSADAIKLLKAKLASQNGGMPQTNKEKQDAFRSRMAMLGMREVRGIYLPDALHPVIKEQATKLLEKHKPEEKK